MRCILSRAASVSLHGMAGMRRMRVRLHEDGMFEQDLEFVMATLPFEENIITVEQYPGQSMSRAHALWLRQRRRWWVPGPKGYDHFAFPAAMALLSPRAYCVAELRA